MSQKNQSEPVDVGDAVKALAVQGRAMLKEGNRRRIIARNPENTIVLDVSVTQAVVAGIICAWIGPVGWLVLMAVVGFGMSKKLRLDFVRELAEGDDTISVSAKQKRLSTDEGDEMDENSATTIDDESVKAKRN